MDNRIAITVTEAAAAIGIGRTAAYAAAQRGDIPSVRIGGRLLVPRQPLFEKFGVTSLREEAELPKSA